MSDPITPKTNTQLFGHDYAQQALWRDYASGKLAHGWLISGPQGIGKATLAYRFARFLLSSPLAGEDQGGGAIDGSQNFPPPPHPDLPPQGGKGNDPSSPVFQRMLADSHTDFRVIEPIFDEKKEEFAREISVEQAREIAQFMRLTPGESQWRVVIVDSIDQLNNNAANAILKILEEPPAQALLMLISHNPGKLLPTIRSRCRQLRLKPLDEEDFTRVMRHASPHTDDDALVPLEQLSDGSPGIAMELDRQGALALYEEILDIVAMLPELNTKKLHGFADTLGTGQVHQQWQLFTRLMLCLIARITKQAAGMRLPEIVPGEGQALARLALLHPPAMWAARWQQTQEQFLLAQSRHLDYKQVIITFFHSLATRDGFKIGSSAA